MFALILIAWLETKSVVVDESAARTSTLCRVVTQTIMGCEGVWPPRRCELSSWWVCALGGDVPPDDRVAIDDGAHEQRALSYG